MFGLGFFDRRMEFAIIHLYSILHREEEHSTNRLQLFYQSLNTNPAVGYTAYSNFLLDRKGLPHNCLKQRLILD